MHNSLESLDYGQIKYVVQVGSEKALALVQSHLNKGEATVTNIELQIICFHQTDHLIAVYLDNIV